MARHRYNPVTIDPGPFDNDDVSAKAKGKRGAFAGLLGDGSLHSPLYRGKSKYPSLTVLAMIAAASFIMGIFVAGIFYARPVSYNDYSSKTVNQFNELRSKILTTTTLVKSGLHDLPTDIDAAVKEADSKWKQMYDGNDNLMPVFTQELILNNL
jgi:hypothetical protein